MVGNKNPVARFCVMGKYAKGKNKGVGTSAIYRLLKPDIILRLGTNFAVLTRM